MGAKGSQKTRNRRANRRQLPWVRGKFEAHPNKGIRRRIKAKTLIRATLYTSNDESFLSGLHVASGQLSRSQLVSTLWHHLTKTDWHWVKCFVEEMLSYSPIVQRIWPILKKCAKSDCFVSQTVVKMFFEEWVFTRELPWRCIPCIEGWRFIIYSVVMK